MRVKKHLTKIILSGSNLNKEHNIINAAKAPKKINNKIMKPKKKRHVKIRQKVDDETLTTQEMQMIENEISLVRGPS